MVVTHNGLLVNSIYDVQESVVFSGSIAIIDMDGAVIQIPKGEFEKMINKYYDLINKRNTVIQHQEAQVAHPTSSTGVFA